MVCHLKQDDRIGQAGKFCTNRRVQKNKPVLADKILLLPALKAVALTKPGAVRPARIISPATCEARFAS